MFCRAVLSPHATSFYPRWREYYNYERLKRGALERKLKFANDKLQFAEERREQAESKLSTSVRQTASEDSWAKLFEFEEKVSRQQKQLDKAQKRLKVLRSKDSGSVVKSDIMIM